MCEIQSIQESVPLKSIVLETIVFSWQEHFDKGEYSCQLHPIVSKTIFFPLNF